MCAGMHDAMIRTGLVLSLLALGCGLLPAEPLAFREYPLKDVSYAEAVDVVRTVTKRTFAERFGGGFSIEWDDEAGNLAVSPIEIGGRRLRMHIHLEERGRDAVVEMFALVDRLQEGSVPSWGEHQQDVPFEEMLYEAYLVELLERRGEGG